MKNTILALLVSSLAAFGVQLSDKTMVRCGAMVTPPKIDGRIDLGEWDYASTTFGGITPATGLMTFRECNFSTSPAPARCQGRRSRCIQRIWWN